MPAPVHDEALLPTQARSVSAARHRLSDLLDRVGADDLHEPAVLALSELVTNAVVHAGSDVRLRMWAAPGALRVEVGDDSPHRPVVRDFAVTAGTGRGLRLVAESVDRWGADPRGGGKVVWFEMGAPQVAMPPEPEPDGAAPTGPVAAGTVAVTLLDVPVLMHWAWQEHAQALLREYLLVMLDDDPRALERHAQASEALAVLHEQVPRPDLPDDPTALLADTLEPVVTVPRVELQVPVASVASFVALDRQLGQAVEAAAAGLFLGPPTQPEIGEMREWICDEVARQAAGHGEPRPWRTRTDVRTALRDRDELLRRYERLALDGEVLATDDASVIVAVSPSVATFLGYSGPADLVGRRVIAVVPHRYHQAHIAGTTLNATNGRDELLSLPLTVPVLRADGSEVPVGLCVRPALFEGRRVFVAVFELPD